MQVQKDKLALAALPIAIYLLATSVTVDFSGSSCQSEEGSEMREALCVSQSVDTKVYKEYFGFVELPVYFAGYDIDFLNKILFLYSAVLAGITLKTTVS